MVTALSSTPAPSPRDETSERRVESAGAAAAADPKARNEALVAKEFRAQAAVLRARPMFLQIETTNRCDFSCRICERNYARVEKCDLDPALIDKLEAAVFPYLRDSSLQCFGEPLLDPNFDAVLERMLANSVHVGFTTNGSRLTPERLERYIAAGVYLCVSLDGATAETYNKIRPQGKFDRLVDTLSLMPSLKARHPDSGAYLKIHFVATRENVDELPAMIDLAERLGADEIEVLNFLTVRLPPEVAAQSLARDPERANRRFREAMRRAESSPVRLALPPFFDSPDEPFDPSAARNYILWPKLEDSRSPYPNSCSEPWTTFVVSANGDVRTCCIWPYPLGNLRDQSFEDIWNGAPFRKVRRRVNSRYPQSPCKECTLWHGVNAGRKEAVQAALPLDCRAHSALQRWAPRARAAMRRAFGG